MIVMKFGGSSVGDAERIREVREIVRARLDQKPVVVSSAMKGVTDKLFELADMALKGRGTSVEQLHEQHRKHARDLGIDPGIFDSLFQEFGHLLKGISLIKELTPRTLDYAVSFGERLAVRMIAAAFRQDGIKAEAHDAFDVGMITDDQFGSARPLPQANGEIHKAVRALDHVPVITGYIGKCRSGDITTLGRGGSDYSASIIGAAIGAEEIQIWTDVDGVMSADPKVCPDARPIKTMTFNEASELAYYGGRVLHPSTIVPAIESGVPVKVLNTFRPEAPGTTIVAEEKDPPPGPKSVVYQRGQMVVNISSSRMLMGHGFLARIFEIFGRHEIVVNMVSTSEVTVSVTVHRPRNLEEAVEEQLQEAVEDLKKFAEVEIERDRAIVCVVGEGLRRRPGVVGDIFAAIRDSGVNVLMISQGASKVNVAFLVEDESAQKAVRALHDAFFAARTPVGAKKA